MNLHLVAAPLIAAVNPMMVVGIGVSVGYTTNPDATRSPKYASPGAITASIAGTLMTVTAIGSGVLQLGQTLDDTDGGVSLGGGLLPGTMITGYESGSGGIGTYDVSQSQTVAAEAMTTGMALYAQMQPLAGNDLRHVDMINLQGSHKVAYINGELRGGVRVTVRGGDLLTLPNGSQWLVTQVLEPWGLTAGWTKALVTLQDTTGMPPPSPSIAGQLDYSIPGNPLLTPLT